MPEICEVTGIIYKYEGQNVPAVKIPVTVERVVLAGQLYSIFSCTRYTDENGNISLKLPQGSVAYIFADVEGMDFDGGIALPIPTDPTADINDLVPIDSVPTDGLTIKANGVALPSKVGVLDFTGDVEASLIGGVAVVNFSGIPGDSPDWGDIGGTLSDQTDLAAALSARPTLTAADARYAMLSHTQAISTVTGLQAALDAKQASLGYTAENLANKNQNSGYAGLDSSGKINPSQLPAIAISSFLGSVASQVAMLALSGQEGDWAIRTDTGTTWLIVGADPTQLSSWQQLATPTDLVSSVFGRTGTVTAQANDYTFAQLASKPTTLSGYGITDAQGLNQNLTDIAGLVDPNADKLIFWDDSAGHYVHLTLGTNLSITGTTLDAAGGGGTAPGTDNTDDFGTSSLRWKDIYLGGSLKWGGTSASPMLKPDNENLQFRRADDSDWVQTRAAGYEVYQNGFGTSRRTFLVYGTPPYQGVFMASGFPLGWSGDANNAGSNDIEFRRQAAKIVGILDGASGGGGLELLEMTAPSAGAADTARIYAEDNGSGKTRIMAKFSDGSTAQIAIQP